MICKSLDLIFAMRTLSFQLSTLTEHQQFLPYSRISSHAETFTLTFVSKYQNFSDRKCESGVKRRMNCSVYLRRCGDIDYEAELIDFHFFLSDNIFFWNFSSYPSFYLGFFFFKFLYFFSRLFCRSFLSSTPNFICYICLFYYYLFIYLFFDGFGSFRFHFHQIFFILFYYFILSLSFLPKKQENI